MFAINATSGLLNLCNGDSMEQAQFHSLYEQARQGFRAELLDGIVFVSEPVGLEHAKIHSLLSYLFYVYSTKTPGIELYDNASVILGVKDEVQPDLTLRILPEFGGRTSNMADPDKTHRIYIAGAPELVIEVAHSSRAIDLHVKRMRYTQAGICEYIVLCVEPQTLHWFDLHLDIEFSATKKGIIKSQVFPGLWLNESAVLGGDVEDATRTLQAGLRSAEHKRFKTSLSQRLNP